MTIMDVNDITCAILAIQIMLHDLGSSLIMASHALPNFRNKRVEGQSLRAAVYSRYKFRGCNDIDFPIEHWQCVNGQFTFRTKRALDLERD